MYKYLKILMYLFVSLAYIFHSKLGKSTYMVVGTIYLIIFLLELLQISWSDSSKDKKI